MLKWWEENDTFLESVRRSEGKKPYVFYDGPPFATGLPHYGHLLAGTIKVRALAATHLRLRTCRPCGRLRSRMRHARSQRLSHQSPWHDPCFLLGGVPPALHCMVSVACLGAPIWRNTAIRGPRSWAALIGQLSILRRERALRCGVVLAHACLAVSRGRVDAPLSLRTVAARRPPHHGAAPAHLPAVPCAQRPVRGWSTSLVLCARV